MRPCFASSADEKLMLKPYKHPCDCLPYYHHYWVILSLFLYLSSYHSFSDCIWSLYHRRTNGKISLWFLTPKPGFVLCLNDFHLDSYYICSVQFSAGVDMVFIIVMIINSILWFVLCLNYFHLDWSYDLDWFYDSNPELVLWDKGMRLLFRCDSTYPCQ